MARAKILNDGGDQTVRLPKSCKFPDDQKEVIVRKEGDRVVLEPVPRKKEWSKAFLAALGAWDEPIERPPQRPITEKKDPFD